MLYRPRDPRGPYTGDMGKVPKQLHKSPLFQLERLRKLTRDAVEAALSQTGITVREYWVLTMLAEGPTTQQAEICEALALDPSEVVRILTGLVKMQLVTRDRDPQDRRRQIVALTVEGKKLQKKAADTVATAEQTALDDSSKKQLKQLRKMSKAVL